MLVFCDECILLAIKFDACCFSIPIHSGWCNASKAWKGDWWCGCENWGPLASTWQVVISCRQFFVLPSLFCQQYRPSILLWWFNDQRHLFYMCHYHSHEIMTVLFSWTNFTYLIYILLFYFVFITISKREVMHYVRIIHFLQKIALSRINTSFLFLISYSAAMFDGHRHFFYMLGKKIHGDYGCFFFFFWKMWITSVLYDWYVYII